MHCSALRVFAWPSLDSEHSTGRLNRRGCVAGGGSCRNYFANHINESVILDMADAMVSTGLAKAGYEYINIDAGYLTRPRDTSKRLVVNSQKFPSGIKHLADRIHAMGLKLGVYTDLGVGSCGTVSTYSRFPSAGLHKPHELR